MQRVRMSLPFFLEFGWHPTVLAVKPSGHEPIEPLLEETLPAGVDVIRVESLSPNISRLVGVGNVALRSMSALYQAGARLLRNDGFDLVYFSTTMFMCMPLGRLWKRRFGTRYVLDLQDPWLSDYYETHPDVTPPPKYALARMVHSRLEPWTMRDVGGLIAVSGAYLDTLTRRYPWLDAVPKATLPFGATAADFAVLERRPQPNPFTHAPGTRQGIYVGRGGQDLKPALEIVFRALKLGRERVPELFADVVLDFVGTDYADASRSQHTIAPVAADFGLDAQVRETPARVPYFQALQLLKDADFLLIVGSDDPGYTASKIFPYVLADKPLLAVMHEASSVVEMLRGMGTGTVVTFSSDRTERETAAAAETLFVAWHELLVGHHARTDWREFERYSARELTRRQCALFDRVVDAEDRTAA